MKIFLNFYKNRIIKYPILTRCVFTSVALTISNTTYQSIYLKKINNKKILKTSLLGFFFIGFPLALWQKKYFILLQKKFFLKFPNLLKFEKFSILFIDQIFWGSYFSFVFSFFEKFEFSQQFDFHFFFENVKENFFFVFFLHSRFWTFLNFINYFYLPVIYRSLYISFFTMFWNFWLEFNFLNKNKIS